MQNIMNRKQITPILKCRICHVILLMWNVPQKSTFSITCQTNQSTIETIICKTPIDMYVDILLYCYPRLSHLLPYNCWYSQGWEYLLLENITIFQMARGKALRRKLVLRKILILKIIQMGIVLFAVEECKKKKKILKEKECACVWACVHACLCVYCHGKSRSTEVKFRIGKSIDA